MLCLYLTTLAPPSAPTGTILSTPRALSAFFVWSTPADTGRGSSDASLITSYEVSYATDGIFASNLVGPITLTASTFNYTATGLVRNSVYFFRVRAFSAAGSSAYSSTLSITAIC